MRVSHLTKAVSKLMSQGDANFQVPWFIVLRKLEKDMVTYAEDVMNLISVLFPIIISEILKGTVDTLWYYGCSSKTAAFFECKER